MKRLPTHDDWNTYYEEDNAKTEPDKPLPPKNPEDIERRKNER